VSRPGRLTAVARLTLSYVVLFAAATAMIVFGTYALVVHEVEADPGPRNPPEVEAQLADALTDDSTGALFEQAADNARAQILTDLLHRSLAVFAVGVGLSAIGAWWLARRSLRPVRHLASLAQGISVGNLNDRIALEGPNDELKELADTFDSMLARLEQAFNAQRAFAGQVSHELRTPLAVLRAEAELVKEASSAGCGDPLLADAVLKQVDRADQLVHSLLALARADSGTTRHERVDLADLVGEVVAALSAAADSAGVKVDLRLSNATVTGDAVLLRALVANLVRNAINYNMVGGLVEVEVMATAAHSTLVVANTGRLLSRTEVSQLTEPFVRAPVDRHRIDGHGIGVAVVMAVVAAHNASFQLEPRPGGGLNATAVFPLALPQIG
jgi:signal transduction histidine kinase